MKYSLCTFAVLALIQWNVVGQTNFLVTPSLGFQVSFPGQEDYRYQVSSSTDLTNWSPITDVKVSCGSTETFSIGMTNGPHAFYRVEEYPPDLASRIVGLTNIYFDNAVFSGQGASMTLSGFRVQSRDYNLNDYLQANFQFDFCKQAFSLTSLQVFTNVGVVCGQSPQYFMKDATNQLVLTNELTGTTLTPDTYHTITSTGQVMTVNLGVAQSFAVTLSNPAQTNEFIITDPNGKVLRDTILSPGGTWLLQGYGGLVSGVYQLQLIPRGVSSESITFGFHNDDGHVLQTLTNGMSFSTSIGPYHGDYAKFQLALNAGQTLQLNGPGANAELVLYNSLGVEVNHRYNGGAPFITPISASGTYYLVYYFTDLGTTHNYSSTVSITP